MPDAGPWSRVAVEFARRAYALAAGGRAASGTRAQARFAGTVDAVPHDRGLHRSRLAEGSVRAVSGRTRCGWSAAGSVRAVDDLWQRADDREVQREPARCRAWAWILEG